MLDGCGVTVMGDRTAIRNALRALISSGGAGVGGGGSIGSGGGGDSTNATTMSTNQQKQRLCDVLQEPLSNLNPIHGLMEAPLLSLAAAARKTCVPQLEAFVIIAQMEGEEKSPGDPHGLNADEIAAIRMYTADSQLYPRLNALLRARSRQALKPFFSYLRLMLMARAKMPKHTGAVWCGVAGVDLRAKYPDGKRVTWWAFSSTTKRLDTLLNPQFLGQSGVRTVFMIEIATGVDIVRVC